MIKKTITIFSLLFSVLFCYAQNNSLDSLKQALSIEKNNEKKLEILNEIVTVYFGKDLNKAKDYANLGVKLSVKTNNKDWQPKFFEMQGRMHANLLELDSASYYFDKALKGYTAIENKKGQATTYFKIGWIHKRKGEIEDALKVDLDALSLMESIDDKLGIAGANSRISEDLYMQGRYHEALNYAIKNIEFCKANNLDEELVYAYDAAGDANMYIGDFTASLMYFEKAIELAEILEFSIISISDFQNSRANALKRLGKYSEALIEYKNTLALAEKANYKNAINALIANIGEVNMLLGNYEEALKYQLKTVKAQEDDGDLSNLTENYEHVSTIYENLGNYPLALEYQKKARIMRDSTAKIESDKAMSELLTQFESAKKDETIVLQNAKISQQQKAQLLYISIASLLALGLIGMYFSIKNIRGKRKALQLLNVELDTKNKQNELLLREIHHRVKNNLEMVKSLIALQSAQLEDSATKDAMIESQNRVQSMGIIHQKLYQGENLGSIEMKDYFVNLSDGILDSFNAEDKVKIECAMDNLELDVDTAVPIGLIVNELLTNALKYAFPEETKGIIKISLSKTSDSILTLIVVDNGIGKAAELAPKGTGFGTQLIQLLTQQLNGKMKEETSTGTSVSFQFKLKSAA